MLEELPRTNAKVFQLKCRSVGKPISRNGITNHIIETAKKAGVKLTMHKLRKRVRLSGREIARQGERPDFASADAAFLDASHYGLLSFRRRRPE